MARVLITCQTLANALRLHCFDAIGLNFADGFARLIADVFAGLGNFDTHDDISELSK